MNQAELLLPKYILEKAIHTNNEIGWQKSDILEVIEVAKQHKLVSLGGEIQYRLPNATCELYWLSYGSQDQKPNEDWVTYCNRSAQECTKQITKLFELDLEKEAISTFEMLKKVEDLNKYLVFILYLTTPNDI